MVWPAVIAAGAAIAGGLLSDRNARKQQAQEQALQREFAQNSIQWKTKDAKAAGLHPLYALGSGATPYSPTTYSSSMGPALASAGQSVANAYIRRDAQKNTDRQFNKSVSDSNFMRKMAQDQMILEQQKLRSEINYNNMLAASIAARASQASNSQQDTTVPGITDEDAPLRGGLVQEEPVRIPSPSKKNPSHTAGISPGWRLVNLGPINAVTPYSEEGWGEDLNLSKLGVIAAATTAYYTYGVALPKISQFIKDNYRDIVRSLSYQKTLAKLESNSPRIQRIEKFGLGQPRPRRR